MSKEKLGTCDNGACNGKFRHVKQDDCVNFREQPQGEPSLTNWGFSGNIRTPAPQPISPPAQSSAGTAREWYAKKYGVSEYCQRWTPEEAEAFAAQQNAQLRQDIIKRESMLDKYAETERKLNKEVEKLRQERDALNDKYREEYAIVDRVWKALRIRKYEQAKGKAIDTIVADTLERCERAESALRTAEKVIEAARCIKHWHDNPKIGGMVVSDEAVRNLWQALGKYDKALAALKSSESEVGDESKS